MSLMAVAEYYGMQSPAPYNSVDINKYKEKRARKKNARNERLFRVKKMNRLAISGYIGWPFIKIINETNLNKK